MREVGTIAGIYRYPVKSMLGEELDASLLGQNGIPGDRAGVSVTSCEETSTSEREAPP